MPRESKEATPLPNGAHSNGVTGTHAKPAVKRKTPKRNNVRRNKTVRPAGEPTSARVTKLALNWIDFQKTTFDNSLKLLGVLQDQTDKALHQVLGSIPYLPKEGRKVVEEWMKTVKRNRDEFGKAMDRSFELMSNYLRRVQSEEEKRRAIPAAKQSSKRRRT